MLLTSWADPNKTDVVVGISYTTPHGAKHDFHIPSLYPEWSLVEGFKQGQITWEDYRELYLELLRARWDIGLKHTIMGLKDNMTLCCWCFDANICHRSIVAEILRKARPDLEVTVR